VSGRPTGEIVADLRDAADVFQADGMIFTPDTMREAADRLTELDAEVSELRGRGTMPNSVSRPTCPTCGGTQKVPGMVMLDARNGAGYGEVPCPDCSDGKMSFEWMAAIVNAVFNSATWTHHSRDEAEIILRSVRP
jgi:hypothetical protein